jgi:hypothetical protein
VSREPEWQELENDDVWLDDEETDADDDTPILDGGNDLEWEGDDDDDEWDEEC